MSPPVGAFPSGLGHAGLPRLLHVAAHLYHDLRESPPRCGRDVTRVARLGRTCHRQPMPALRGGSHLRSPTCRRPHGPSARPSPDGPPTTASWSSLAPAPVGDTPASDRASGSDIHEEDVPAQPTPPFPPARLPPPHGHPPGSGGDPGAPAEGPEAPDDGVISSVRDRRTFAALRRAPRGACGPVRVRYLPSPSPEHAAAPVEVAYALPRHVGNAVTRNRVRRRLRAVMADLDRAPSSGLASGAYLLNGSAECASTSYAELTRATACAISRAGARAREGRQ